MMTDLIERLQNEADYLRRGPCKSASIALDAAIAEITQVTDEVARLGAEADALADSLQEIKQWAEAYSVEVFTEQDLKLADRVLSDAGISMTAMNGSFARCLLDGVGGIATTALTGR